MSSETLNPHDENAETAQPNLKDSILNPENLEALAAVGIQTVQSIEQIPAQLDLLNRVTLARGFISDHPTDSGKKIFDSEGYNKLWSIIAEEEQSKDG